MTAHENPRTWQGRTIKNDMPVGGVVSPYGSSENEDNRDYGLEESVRFDTSGDLQDTHWDVPVEKSFIEKQSDAIMARVTKPAVPLPSAAHIKKMGKLTKGLNEAMAEVSTAAKAMAETVTEVAKGLDKKPFVPQPHLTQKPFKNKALYELRDQLRKTR